MDKFYTKQPPHRVPSPVSLHDDGSNQLPLAAKARGLSIAPTGPTTVHVMRGKPEVCELLRGTINGEL